MLSLEPGVDRVGVTILGVKVTLWKNQRLRSTRRNGRNELIILGRWRCLTCRNGVSPETMAFACLCYSHWRNRCANDCSPGNQDTAQTVRWLSGIWNQVTEAWRNVMSILRWHCQNDRAALDCFVHSLGQWNSNVSSTTNGAMLLFVYWRPVSKCSGSSQIKYPLLDMAMLVSRGLSFPGPQL